MLRRCQLLRLLRRSPLLRADEPKDDVFERYSEIENSNMRRIAALRGTGLFNDEWIATEKVHGANFGIYSTEHGKAIRYAKRSGIMPPSEHFFGYHVLIPDLMRYAQKSRELLTSQLKESPSSIVINGELFGGKYDHPNLQKKREIVIVAGKPRAISAVQNDPFPQYSPSLHFYAFDVKYKLADTDPEYTTLTYDEAAAIFEAIPGLLYAKAIIRGPLSKVAAFNVETFTTTIPPLVGMGDYPLRGNWAEGLVVKHCKRGKPGFAPNANTILKFKSTAFQEISTDRQQGPRVDEMEEVRRQSIQISGEQLPDLESVIRDAEVRAATLHLLDHVCDNRMKSVLSKIGTEPFESQTMTPDALATLLAKDALKDFLKEAEPKVVNSPLLLRREITRYVLFESRKYVASKWKEIVSRQKEADSDAAQ